MDQEDLKEIVDNLRFLIAVNDKPKLKTLLLSTHPADVADIFTHLTEDERDFLFALLPPDVASDVIVELDDFHRENILEDLQEDRLSELVDEMDSDDATDVVADLPEEIADKILQSIDKQDSAEVKELMRHDEESAGGIMALEYVVVNQESTVDDAIQEIRKKAEEVEDLYYVYVIDNDGKLVGTLSLKALILSAGKKKVADVMERDVISVHEGIDQEEVANVARKYDLVAVPVVDAHDRLVGRITFDDIVDVMEDEASEDIHRLAGISIDEEIHEQSVFKVSRVRLPWLLVAFGGEIISALILNNFEHTLKQIIIAAFFIPIIMAMGGNAGIQSSTVIVRGLATGEIGLLHIKRQLFREIRVSLFNGSVCATLIFLIVGFWFKDINFGVVLALSIFIIMVMASFVGASIPLLLKKFNIDPAIATGPFITTANDSFGLMIYFALATLYLLYIS
ncbi:magnesium transporter [candidate division KSB1 bacterium]|nr:magnesium transporter [candidate division KSB1 bacterium]